MITIEQPVVHNPTEVFNIRPTSPYAMHSSEVAEHVEHIVKLLKRCISRECSRYDQTELLKLPQKLPIIFWDPPKNAPGCIECIILCTLPKETGVEGKLESILRGCLNPGKTAQILAQSSLSFHWDLFPGSSFFITRLKSLVENKNDMEKILSGLPSFTMQLRSALKNSASLKSFFPQKPLLQELKQAQIHQDLVGLLERFPHFFTSDLFLEMSRFFALCEKPFFEPRTSRLITKIISSHYLMRPSLTRLLSLYPEKRHVEVRCVKTDLHFYFGSKPVLGLILGISPLDNHEFFEESHISQAVQFLLPHVNTIKSSFYSYQRLHDPICTLYVELEKKDGTVFNTEELLTLKNGLPEELKRRIEKLVPAVFMARNEEEVMRNILLLSQELRYLSDIPQVIISLDTQNLSEITFTVVLVRLVKPGQLPIRKCFENMKSSVKFIQDRTQQVGFLRKNHPKEANVFHLKIPKDPSLLRADYSVNFYPVRDKAAAILFEAIGPFRDYNGGMILKQGELFYQFQDSFPDIAKKNPELLENFFFSLSPIEAQATLPLSSLKILFHQFLEAQKEELSQKEDYFLRIEENSGLLFAMTRIQGKTFKDDLNTALNNRELLSKALIYNSIQLQGSLYMGIILSHPEEKKRQLFIEAIHEGVRNWVQRVQNQQLLKLSFSGLPPSLDPRLAGEKSAHIITKMLFEGLTRLNEKGIPAPAIAKSIEISADEKTYTFKLRPSYWSNGAQITSYDFEYSWKKVISPQSFTPFTYVFYPIKNAKAIKEGLCPVDQAGIQTPDEETLIVELEHPTPDFLELTAHSLYSPVHHVTDKVHPNWATKGSEDFVCNGPFLLKEIINHNRYDLIKNPLYWDKDHVLLQKIRLSKNSTFIANEMFKKEELHWIGSSMGPWEFFLENNKEPKLHSTYIGIYWCVFNTEKFPFHNTLLRQAFNLAIDKQYLASTIDNDHLPACTPLPLSHTMNHDPSRSFANEEKALELFELALKELGLTRKTFPLITLSFLDTPLRRKTFSYIREKWKNLFQIPCRLEAFDFYTLFSKTTKGDFQVSGTYWKTWIDNPGYLLEIFKYGQLDINVAKWSNARYEQLLHQAQQTIDPVKRIKYLSDAEKILIHEVPVIPLFYEREKNIKKPYLHRVIHSKTTGFIDFKHAYIDKKSAESNQTHNP